MPSAVRLLPDPGLADDCQDLAAIEIEIEIRDRVKTAA